MAVTEARRAWISTNKIKLREYYKLWKRKHRKRSQYGIEHHEFEALKQAQGGLCAICGNPPKAYPNRVEHFCIDHDHVTGKIRGLLCNLCNRVLGFVEENPKTLRAAAEYLERCRS